VLIGFSILRFRGVGQPQKFVDFKALRNLKQQFLQLGGGVGEVSRVVSGGGGSELPIKLRMIHAGRLALPSSSRKIQQAREEDGENNTHEPASEDHSVRMLAPWCAGWSTCLRKQQGKAFC